jgi:Family of unknown function (DUF6412)
MSRARTVDDVIGFDVVRGRAAVILAVLGIATAELESRWQLTQQAVAAPSVLLAAAAIALAGAIVALLSTAGTLASALMAGPLLQRAVAMRRKSWGAVFQRQLNPDAAGHARPRAPSAAPAAA